MRSEFFFSSRRRHTILQGDWSSDVCSSDLARLLLGLDSAFRLRRLPRFLRIPHPASRISLPDSRFPGSRSEEHTSELQSPCNLVCRLLLEKKKQSTFHLSQHLHPAVAACTAPLSWPT